jgi:hypothetical protein
MILAADNPRRPPAYVLSRSSYLCGRAHFIGHTRRLLIVQDSVRHTRLFHRTPHATERARKKIRVVRDVRELGWTLMLAAPRERKNG